ncbi:hypothetical protein [Pseudooctadecabacter jejudonensis]|uniref:Phosphoadenosine phosphosulfate reductase n=1 Tax=Pseudooctadecabacter jejudonensis TaxID=1391910 RepID=A0A1Y5TF33_9RHOB|nr:hypothetical protein [Pseudooctadecabacter jejudonensis]SLN58858.1 hypothetical protein PSJ8397_03116 [Pseudooctadecabacter jejudonensis]
MKDISAAFQFDLTNLAFEPWLDLLDDVSEEFGHFEPLGPDHSAAFIDAGRTLLVTFEAAPTVHKSNANHAPLGWQFVQSHGWSSLTVMSHNRQDWFRHDAVFGYFDRMIDDGFFDDFDQILFYGAGARAYAAAAFSVAAPDARALLIQPQATLDTDRAGWDKRFPQTRRLDFSTRYGYAPDMVETASDVWVIHDPDVLEDAVHAQMFDADHVHHLTARHVGPNADRAFMDVGVWADLVEQAMSGDLTPARYGAVWRARFNNLKYMRQLFDRLVSSDTHPRLLAWVCRAMTRDNDRPLFAQKLAELEAKGVKV